MRYIADLHVHSHYSRATSKDLNLESLYQWAKIKGINVVGTGDFTHPEWFAELREKLQPEGNGFFTLKNPPKEPAIPGIKTRDIEVRFCLTTEISSIYKYDDRVRKNHNLVYARDLDTVARINHQLSSIGNLEADGRPILGLPSRDLLEIVLESADNAYLVPAHIWTPWFSTLGSKAGYDSIKACYRDLSDNLFAVETGLSSDPAMNWKLSNLDRFTLISNSDAHSPSKLGREANLLETEFSYDAMFDAFKSGVGFSGTYEFYPQEGKYHHDGHRKCNTSFEPRETRKHDGKCPECGKPLTIGVLHRVEDLADRNDIQKPDDASDYRYLIPLPEVLGEIEDVGPKSKKVQRKYRDVISSFGNEYSLLHEVPVDEVRKTKGPVLAEAVKRIRNDEVNPRAGYDGVFGTIKVFKHGDIDRIRGQLGFFGTGNSYGESETSAPEEVTEPEAGDRKEQYIVDGKTSSTCKLNTQQEEVKQSVNGVTLVKAGPGTGKTHTLVEWLVEQVKSKECTPAQLMAVTFTNKSAEELKQRLTKRLGPRAESATVGTFHSIAWRLLREKKADLSTVYDRSARRMVFTILFPDLKSAERQQLEEEMTAHFELGVQPSSQFRDYITRYQKYLQRQEAVDLTDIINRLVSIVKGDVDYRDQLRARYKAIAVDEFQDINPVQYQMVEQLAGSVEQSILAIGDPDQAIYGFRGADLSLFYSFVRDFKASEVTLKQNYRSTGPILESAGAVIRNNEINSGITLKSNKEKESPVNIHGADNAFEEADHILDQVERYIGGIDNLGTGKYTDSEYTYGLGDIAILFRTNAVGEALFKSFVKAGIPVHFGDGTSFLSEPPFTAITNMLRLQLNPANRIALSDLLKESFGWSQAQVNSLLQKLTNNKATLFERDLAESIGAVLQDDLNELSAVFQKLSTTLDDEGLKKAVGYLCSEFMPDDLLTDEQILKKETLLELVGESSRDVEQFLETMQLNPYTDAGRLASEGVRLLTFHAAKGLEFPVVFIAAAEEGIAPLTLEGVNIEEERRLFYVAMTRAEEELNISYSRERYRYGEKQQMKRSRFISEIPESLKRYTGKEKEQASHPNPGQPDQLGLFS